MGLIQEHNPITKAMLHIIEPMAFPIAISECPSLLATVETKNSGRVVAILTIVAPITIEGIPVFLAIQIAASTNKSPPLTIVKRPMKKITKTITVSIFIHQPFLCINIYIYQYTFQYYIF